MAKNKNLALDGQGIQKTMSLKNFLGDSVGMIALNGMSGLVGMLTYFYTDKVGIAAAAAGTIMIIAKIIDAFTDLAMGHIMERTKSRFGKARPWIIRMAIPAFIAVVAIFCVPSQASSAVKFSYGLLSNAFATAIVYTAIAIPYGCLMAYVTRSTEERSKMGIFRALLGYIIGMIIAIGLIPLTNALGGDQAAWIKLGVIFGIIIAVSLVIAFISNKERYSSQTDADGNVIEEEKIPFFTAVNYMFHNKYWVIMLLAMVSINVLYALSGATGIYYAKWILKDENIVAILGAIGLVPVAIGFSITGPMIKRFGLAKTARIALLIGIAGTAARVAFPYDIWSALVFGPFISFGTIPLMAVGGVLVNNTVEYGEWMHGKRLVGMSNSASGFGSKVGSGLGGALIGWVLALGGYDASLAAQSPGALNSILAICIWIPGLMLVLVYVLLRFYDLDAKYPQIVKELDERKQKQS
ncbi:MAG: glycoside-pentoside-hexuronide (GPH):cation symporter [Clostridiales bacterium]|jgi:GPH family glycoside/pentoside/hexuronide:cation symporter|nr:glycoside-pentoside-hexuronide (GPH):cation symporter [Clostridiales bacterium]MDR2751382.1 glycoside-pentoside-hexuronide (GPH):cation symporter [Clostridiales bacterium]